jgi:SAM-dependent methyltransferase
LTAPASTTVVDRLAAQSPPVRLPDSDDSAGLPQDEEWFEVELGRGWRRLRIHDYEAIFSIPGLYEKVVYDLLDCRSPARVRRLLEHQLEARGVESQKLTVLDLGAGNGCVAEELGKLPAVEIVGLDILPEAEEAANRDRPGLYADYVVGDICRLPAGGERRLQERSFDCLVSVAALGFGDIPPEAFANAFNRIEEGGWVAYTIKESFVKNGDGKGFSGLVRRMLQENILELADEEAYSHRLSAAGEPLLYRAFVGQKRRDIGAEELAEVVG